MQPIGNPEAMHAHANRLRMYGNQLYSLAERLQHRIDAIEFEGPAARRFRAEMVERRRRAQRAHQELHDLAGWLDGQVGQLRHEIAEYERQERAKA